MDKRITLGSLFDGIGGFPRQDVSVAGKRAGIKHEDNGDDETTRSGLFFEAIRIIYEMRRETNGKYPTFIVWENVPGAFNSHNGNDFRTVLEEITKTDIPMPASGKWANAGVVRGGAICAAWRLLDARYWGVPQRRKRIYLVGSFGSNCAEEILFKRDSVRRYLAPRGTQGKSVTGDFGAGIGNSSFTFDCRGNGNGRIVPTITGDHNSRVTDYGAVVCYPNVSHTLTAAESGTNRAPCVAYAIQGSMIGRKDKNGPQGDGINENVCFTLNTSDRHAVAYGVNCRNFLTYKELYPTLQEKENGGQSLNFLGAVSCKHIKWIVRRLTPLECERLQGYPDNWTLLPKIEDMEEAEYKFYKTAYLLDKSIKGLAVKTIPNRKQLVRWYNKLDCDGTRYRQLGNSIAIPCALRVIDYIANYIREERTI